MKSIELVKKIQTLVRRDLAEKLPNVPSVGISSCKDEYFLIVYLEEEDSLVEKIIKLLENKYKIHIATRVVGKVQLF